MSNTTAPTKPLVALPATANAATAIALAIISNTEESKKIMLAWWAASVPQTFEESLKLYGEQAEAWKAAGKEAQAQAEVEYKDRLAQMKAGIEKALETGRLTLVLHWSRPGLDTDVNRDKIASLFAGDTRVAMATLDSRTMNCTQALAQINIMFMQPNAKPEVKIIEIQ